MDELADLRERLSEDRDGFLTQTRTRLKRLARARGVPTDMVDDVAQETMLEAWRSLSHLTTPSGFSAWIDEICRNICRRAAHRSAREASRRVSAPSRLNGQDSDEDSITSLADHLSDASDDPISDLIESLFQQDLVTLLDQALGLLPTETRSLVEMCHLRELPHVEIAARLGITSGALDTRLSRARRQLHQALNGPLRNQAEAFGLALDEDSGEGWVETRLWCPLCARKRLQGYFVHFADSAQGPNLHLRCPDCARRYGQDTIHSMGLIALNGLHSFRPAWKRTMQGLTNRVTEALSIGQGLCLFCGRPAAIRVAGRDTDGGPARGPHPFWIRFLCPCCDIESEACGDLPSVDQLVYWSHPVTRQFVLRRPRVTSVWGEPVEKDGALAIPIELVDMESADRITVLAHRRSLRILSLA